LICRFFQSEKIPGRIIIGDGPVSPIEQLNGFF
jgi:hypothetical protein